MATAIVCAGIPTQDLKAQDFEVAPVILNYNAEPGGIQTKTLTVRNHSNKKQSFILSLGDQIRDSLGFKKNLPPGSTKHSCANWVTLNPSFFELNPNESRDIEVLMQVPGNGINTRWVILYVKATEEQSAASVDKNVATGVIVSPRIAVHISQSPLSNQNYKASIQGFREVEASANGDRNFEVKVVNIGDKIIHPKVRLLISNLSSASEKEMGEVSTTVMPGESRIVKLALATNQVKRGNYSLAALLDYGHNTDLEAVQMLIEVK
ncbi:MAG: hypothetical protein AAGB22_12735 [Bacteroidota bacterium]